MVILVIALAFVFGIYYTIENKKLNKKLKEFEKKLIVRKKF